MRRITRYVVIEFLKVFAVGLFAMTLLLVFGVVGQEIVREGLSPLTVLRLIPYAMPMALLYAIPGTTLFAACSLYGRMSASNEVTAIKSLGLSPMSIIWPVLVVAFVLSVSVVWLNDVAVSWGRIGTQRVVLESVEQIAYGMLRTHRSYATKTFSIHVNGIEDERLVGPILTINFSSDQPTMVVSAEYAVLRCDAEAGQLRVFLTNGEVDFGERRHLAFCDTQIINIPLWAAARKGYDTGRPQDTALRRIPAEVESQLQEIERLERTMAADAAFQMLTGDLGALADQRWDRRHHELRDAHSRLHKLYTEPWRRWANGFSCLAFVMVGAPLSVRLRNSDVWTSFAACFLPVLIVYYPMLVYGVKLAKAGELPPYSVWLGNVVFVLIGVWLIRHVIRR